MIRPDHSSLSLARQCRLLSISRSSYYHKPKGESSENLSLMTEIDRQFLETPFYGVQQMTWHLRALGHVVNVRCTRMASLMPIDDENCQCASTP
jgi:putative transposase